MSESRIHTKKLSGEQRELFSMLMEQHGLTWRDIPISKRETTVGPLSTTQERLWSTWQMSSDLPVGNVEMTFRIRGPLDKTRLFESLREVVRRHEILRTVLVEENGMLQQLVLDEPRIPSLEKDLRELPESERLDAGLEWIRAELAKRFDFSGEPWIKWLWANLDHEDHLFSIISNHLASDGWGFRVLLREIAALYNKGSVDRGPPLSELPVQYGDVAEWERQWLPAADFEASLRYWEEQLGGAPAEIPLGSTRARNGGRSFRAEARELDISERTSRAIKELAGRENTTPFIVLLAAWHALIGLHARSHDVVVGTTTSVRNRSELEPLVGNFGNNLLFRALLEEGQPFQSLVRQVRHSVLSAYEHQEVPFEQVVERLQEKSPNCPRFQVAFLFRDSPLEDNLPIQGVSTQSLHLPLGYSTLDLKLELAEGNRFTGFIEFRTGVFDETERDLLSRGFAQVLSLVTSDPEMPIKALRKNVTEGLGDLRRRDVGSASPVPNRPAEPEAPQTDREKRLLRIWEEVLGKRGIGRKDSFFDWGGDSYASIRLFDRINKEFGCRLQISNILQYSTIEALSGLIRQHEAREGFASLVAIHKQGSKPPLFCVHPAGGDVYLYRRVSELLGDDQPVYGFASSRMGDAGGLESVEEIASRYVRELIDFREGPYYLLGVGFGGGVAYEMACQLTEQGKQVELLAMLNVYAPGYPRLTWKPPIVQKRILQWKFWLWDHHIWNLRRLPFREWWGYIRNKILTRHQRPPSYLDNWSAHRRAYRHYRPRRYPYQITVFRGTRAPAYFEPMPCMGWSEVTDGGVDVCEIEGAELLERPQVSDLAEALRKRIDGTEVADDVRQSHKETV